MRNEGKDPQSPEHSREYWERNIWLAAAASSKTAAHDGPSQAAIHATGQEVVKAAILAGRQAPKEILEKYL